MSKNPSRKPGQWEMRLPKATREALRDGVGEFHDLPKAMSVAAKHKKTTLDFIEYIITHSCPTIMSRALEDSGVHPSDRNPMEVEFKREEVGDMIRFSVKDPEQKFVDAALHECRDALRKMGIPVVGIGMEIDFYLSDVEKIRTKILSGAQKEEKLSKGR